MKHLIFFGLLFARSAFAEGSWLVYGSTTMVDPGYGIGVALTGDYEFGMNYSQQHTRRVSDHSFELDQMVKFDFHYTVGEIWNLGAGVDYRQKTLNFGQARGSRREDGVKSVSQIVCIDLSAGLKWEVAAFRFGFDIMELSYPAYRLSHKMKGTSELADGRADDLKTDSKEENRAIQTSLFRLSVGFMF
jgi:hypothetical protein